ncbi:MAG: hypothetical protein HOV94_18280 [Saccharothrix sp.]|nr:hypothetical protein [Saccharothrix sp.]
MNDLVEHARVRDLPACLRTIDTLAPRARRSRPVPEPLETPDDVAAEVAAALTDPDDVVAFERALDGLVRHAHRDRAALAAALKPVVTDPPSLGWERIVSPSDLYDVAAAVRGDEPREWHFLRRYDHPLHRGTQAPTLPPPARFLALRLAAAIEATGTGGQPFLLAVPTRANGALDAGVLVERLAELERLGVEPALADLTQALLRTNPEPDEQVVTAARALRSAAGRRAADWWRDGGAGTWDATPDAWSAADPETLQVAPDLRTAVDNTAAGGLRPVHRAERLHSLMNPAELADAYRRGQNDGWPAPFWVAQLPHHREFVAARTINEPPGTLLRPLAEVGGRAGYALHFALARALFDGAARPRGIAAEAVLVVAAQGELDAGLLRALVEGMERSGSDRAAHVEVAPRERGRTTLLELVVAGDIPALHRALAALTPEELAVDAEELDERFPPDTAQSSSRLTAAVSIACLGTRATPEDAAAWLTTVKHRAEGIAWMVDVVRTRSAGWQRELVEALAPRLWGPDISGPQWAHDPFRLALHLIREHGLAVPTNTTFVRLWLDALRGLDPEAKVALRRDPLSSVLLPLVVSRPEIHHGIHRRAIAEVGVGGLVDRRLLTHRALHDALTGGPREAAAKVLAGTALTPSEEAELLLARRDLIERLIDSLVDGTRDQATTLTDLSLLDLGPEDTLPHVRRHLAMLDLGSTVAAHGQQVLADLDEAGLIEPDVVTEASERILVRSEKKLVRAQLTWLDRSARRDPGRAERVCAEAALAFGHPDVAMQTKALDVVARHLPAAGDSSRAGLRDAAEALAPALAARAAEVLGVDEERRDDAGPWVDVLPDPTPRPVAGPLGSVVEVAQEVAAALAHPADVAAFERALDGLVRLSLEDRDELAIALAPAARREPRFRCCIWTVDHTDLFDVVAAVRRDAPRDTHVGTRFDKPRQGRPEDIDPVLALLRARILEAIELIEDGSQPFLLAVPTNATGALDALTLVARVAELERLGVEPAPVDAGQALLRVTPTADAGVRDAARALRSAAGQALSRWLEAGGIAHQDTTPDSWPVADPLSAGPRDRANGWWAPVYATPVPPTSLPPVVAAVLDKTSGGWHDDRAAAAVAAQLPHHREEVAVIHRGRVDMLLPFLAEAEGPAGYAVHRALADRLRDRTASDDAAGHLLSLAAQGVLDPRLLAGQLRLSSRSHKRLADTLDAAAATGAYATVWSVLEHLLPSLLGDPSVREVGRFLAIAAECATRSGVRGAIPEVDALAGRKGSTQAIKNARLLRDVLRA